MRILFAFLTLCTLLPAQQGALPHIVIDDLALIDGFEAEMTKQLEAGTLPKNSALMKQLRQAPRHLHLPVAASDAIRRSPQEIYRSRLPSTLIVGNLDKCNECPLWHGNFAGGVVIGTNGLALTNYHVMDVPKGQGFAAMDYRGKVYPLERILAADPDNDLALVQFSGLVAKSVRLSKGVSVGSAVTAISHPASHFFSLTHGRASRYVTYPVSEEDDAPTVTCLEITADFAWGSSGSPVYDETGALAGLVVATESIYYDETKRRQTDLQMVIKSIVPAEAIRDLLK